MTERSERRKDTFKSTGIDSGATSNRHRRQAEQLRKEKRSNNILAKRLKLAPAVSGTVTDGVDSILPETYNEQYIASAVAKLQVGYD